MDGQNKEKLETARRTELFKAYMHSDEYQDKIKQRLKINDACNKKAEARAITWNLCARPDNPAEGCIFFIENFGYTFDPRPHTEQKHLPFILFEYQKETIKWLIDHIDNGTDGLLEKSRDMGMSWIMFVMVPLWYWIFKDGTNILLGSYKEKLVDDRTKDSLFGMIDYAIDSLPIWLLPKGYSKDKHRNQLKLTNPVNFNLIAGESMSGDFGRGMRKTAVLFDELGTWDYAKDAWESCGDVTACRIANSTPKGFNFYAKLREMLFPMGGVLTIHWKKHPLKDDKWYEFECARRTEEEVAQELDISYTKSQEGRVYPEWNEVNVERGVFEYNEDLPLYVGWDFGKDDDTAIIWLQPDRDGFNIIDTYCKTGKLIDFFIPLINGIMPSGGYVYNPIELEMINRHKYWKPATHFGDPAGRFHNQVTNETVVSMLKGAGIIVNFRDEWKEWSRRKTAAKLLIRDNIRINKTSSSSYFDMCMTQASYPKVTTEGEKEVRSHMPKHDWTSHYRSSFEYLAQGIKEFNVVRKKPYDKFKKKEGGEINRRRVTGY